MDRTQLPQNLPPEFLAAMMGAAPPPPMAPQAMPLPQVAPEMGVPGPIDPNTAPIGGMPPMAPSMMDAQQPPESAFGDPVMEQMLLNTPPISMVYPYQKRSFDIPRPDAGKIVMYADLDKSVWTGRNDRINRDIQIFRQHEGGVPRDFDPDNQVQYMAAAMSNLVNRLSNMMGGIDPIFEAPYRDEQTEDASQAVENFGYWSRDMDRRFYARSTSGNLQRDEFFFLFLHGAIAARILPDVDDLNYPYTVTLLDPSTVYPTWGGPKDGLVRVSRIYTTTIADILNDYGQYTKGLEKSLMDKFGVEKKSLGEYLNHQIECIEYYDRKWRGVVTRDGIELLKPMEHGYDFVPIVYITAVGEPKAMQTPGGRYTVQSNRGTITRGITQNEDYREKGVSVLHYLVNTNRLREAIFTLLYAEVEKASRPPIMRYRAPQLMKQDIPDMDWDAGGLNAAYLGLEDVQALPTSPRPTDTAPVLNDLEQNFMAGSLNPAAQGMEMGANASGYSLDTLIASAKELVLPYLQAYENYLSMALEMKLRLYMEPISAMVPIRVPNKPLYGSANAMTDLTPDMIDMVGVSIKVKMNNITDQNRPMLAQTAQAMMAAGLISQRAAMDMLGIKNPDKMFADILAEKALQHPLIMELFAIPGALKARGATELADVWAQTVGMQALMNSGLGQPQGPAALGPGGANSPPGQGGISNLGTAGAANAPPPR